jgi:hypothetical protein
MVVTTGVPKLVLVIRTVEPGTVVRKVEPPTVTVAGLGGNVSVTTTTVGFP